MGKHWVEGDEEKKQKSKREGLEVETKEHDKKTGRRSRTSKQTMERLKQGRTKIKSSTEARGRG